MYEKNPEYRPAGYDSRRQNAFSEPYDGPLMNTDRNYAPPEAVTECLTAQITNRLDGALKVIEQMYVALRDRNDSLMGPDATVGPRDDSAKAPATLDRGVMDRITRQTKEILRGLEALEYQVRRLNQL
jgi:hypothetical protein